MTETHQTDHDPDSARPLGDLSAFTRRRRTKPRILLIAILAAAVVTFGGAAVMALILAALANALGPH